MKKRGHPQQSISWLFQTDRGEIEFVCGLFFLLFLFLLLMVHLELFRYETSALYAEDALAASNLASAVIDIQEYGISHRIVVEDYQLAYERYEAALKNNLALNEQWECRNRELISGKVQITNYTVYNVQGETVEWHRRDGDGVWTTEMGDIGSVYTPAGQAVTHTGIYSEITYELTGMTGLTLSAVQSKLVDITNDW